METALLCSLEIVESGDFRLTLHDAMSNCSTTTAHGPSDCLVNPARPSREDRSLSDLAELPRCKGSAEPALSFDRMAETSVEVINPFAEYQWTSQPYPDYNMPRVGPSGAIEKQAFLMLSLDQVADDARPHRTAAVSFFQFSLSKSRLHARTLKAISHHDEKGWWHIIDAKGLASSGPHGHMLCRVRP